MLTLEMMSYTNLLDVGYIPDLFSATCNIRIYAPLYYVLIIYVTDQKIK